MVTLSRETEAFAARIAASRRMSVDEAVRQALEVWSRSVNIASDGLKRRDVSPAAVAQRKANIDRLVAEIGALPILDSRSPREIMDDLDSL